MIRPPDYISKIKPYVPGKPIEELERELGIKNSVKLASNENPIGPSPMALKAVLENLSGSNISSGMNRYPDGNGYYLKNALADKLSIDREEIILGNGSNEVIDIAVRTFMQPGDEAVMASPSFVVYPIDVQAMGGRRIEIPLKNYTHDLKAMGEAVTPRTKMLFVANPNNATGTINKKDEFDRLMDQTPEGVLVVVDEAYYEYVTDPDYADSMKHFREGRDILILRTFSKIYGLASLRIGYGIAKKEIVAEMNKVRPPFNTSSIAQKAAINALNDNSHVNMTKEVNKAGKSYLYKELDSLGLKHVPSQTNFIYIPLGQDANALYDKLLGQGIIVRPMGSQEIRVTIGLPEENKRFIEALKVAIGQ